MSYNIDSVKMLASDAYMEAHDVLRLLRDHEPELPEGCFLHDMEWPARQLMESDVAPKRVKVTGLRWCGEGSGYAFKLLLDGPVGRAIHGTVEAILTWEGGDSHTGLRIRDGVVTEPKVIMTLEDG